MSPDDYCARKAAPTGSALYYALRLAPPARRPGIAAVHAFCREVREVAHEVSDASVAQLKLAWWHTELAAAFAAKAQHPVAQALAQAVVQFKLPQATFDAVIDGVASDLQCAAYPNAGALEAYCRRVGGSIAVLSAQILGGTGSTREFASDLGVGLELTAIIQRLAADVRHGRVYLPQDELARFGVAPEDLVQRRATPAFAALIAHQAERARGFYVRAVSALPASERRAQRPGLVMAAIGEALLAAIERDGFRVLDRRISLTPVAKAWIAWKTSWRR
jgi:15-cis-phytoene synthase